jgi:hypothetical protein
MEKSQATGEATHNRKELTVTPFNGLIDAILRYS